LPRTEPRWLTVADIIAINQDALTETQERHFVRDIRLLEGALARSRTRWHYEEEDDVLALAVALLFAITGAHAFEQGNKRTGYLAFLAFLNLNGWDMAMEDGEADPGIAVMIECVIKREMSQSDFADFVAALIHPLDEA